MPRPANPDLKTDLLNAAIALLDRQGPSFSMRDLSAEINYSTTAVYRCFANKSTLLRAMQVQLFTELATDLAKVPMSAGSIAEQMVALGRAFVGWGVDHPVRYTFMFHNVDPGALLDAEERAMATAPLLALEGLVAAGIATGELAPGNSKAITLLFFSSVHGLVSLHLAQRLSGFTDVSATQTYEEWARIWVNQHAGVRQ